MLNGLRHHLHVALDLLRCVDDLELIARIDLDMAIRLGHLLLHQLDIIDRASIIHAGEVLFEGAPQEIVDNPDVRRVYLGEQFKL